MLVGTTLGGYTLTRLLGSGGMGAVYLAEDQAIGQQVAIKVVRTDESMSIDPQSEVQATERFRQEARSVASLDHLHILPLYRYGEEETIDGRRAYMVMQYRPEGSLWDWLRRRARLSFTASLTSAPLLPAGLPTTWPLAVDEAAAYLRQAASALQYAHDRGIVHRDVKPANFLLRFDATGASQTGVFLLLSDFGLAKFYSSTSATSTVFGTPTYMAPEQFKGPVGPESDQYALAIMIYYLLAGRPPFEGEPMLLMHQHIAVEPPAIRKLVPTLSAGVESVLARALAKIPSQRYPSITAFADAFRQHMYEPAGRQSQQYSLPTRLMDDQTQDKGGVHTEQTPLPSNAHLLNASTGQSQISLEPPTVLPTTPSQQDSDSAPPVYTYSHTPSSRQYPTIQNQSSANLPTQLQVSAPQDAAPTPQPASPAKQPVSRRHALGWLLGGAALAAGIGTGIYFYLDRSPSAEKYILKGHRSGVTSVSWSPDGTRLVSGAQDSTAHIWRIDTQQTILIYKGHHLPVFSVAWSPNATLLASGGRDNTIQVWDTTGALKHNFAGLGAPVGDIAWTPSSGILFAGTLGGGIREISLSMGASTPRGLKGFIRSIAISPNGRYLAMGAAGGMVSIFTLPILRPLALRRIHTGAVLSLAWSSNSAWLASGGTDKSVQIMEVPSSRIISSLAHNAAVNGIAWEPGNTGRLATAEADGTMRVWKVNDKTSTAVGNHSAALTSLAWGARGIATGSTDSTIIIWNV